MTGPKRVASVKATGSRRLIPHEVYGTEEEAIPLTVNASKNLFGDMNYKKSLTQASNAGRASHVNHSYQVFTQS